MPSKRGLTTCHKIATVCVLPEADEDRTQLSGRNPRSGDLRSYRHLPWIRHACEIINQLISRGFIRDPGNNPREDVVQRLAEMAEKMRRERATADQPAESDWKQSQSNGQFP